MCARAWPLSSDKIAITRRCTTLAGWYLVRIHAQAGRTTRLAPFKARFDEYPVKPFGFCHLLHEAAAGNDDCPFDVIRLFAVFKDGGSSAKIFNAAVGATADENIFNRYIGHRRARRQPHIIQ